MGRVRLIKSPVWSRRAELLADQHPFARAGGGTSMIFSSAPYIRDHDEPSRAFAAFRQTHKGQPPTGVPGQHLGAVTHYLKGDPAAGTDEAVAGDAEDARHSDQRLHDENGQLRIDGTVVREMFLLRAKNRRTPKANGIYWR